MKKKNKRTRIEKKIIRILELNLEKTLKNQKALIKLKEDNCLTAPCTVTRSRRMSITTTAR